MQDETQAGSELSGGLGAGLAELERIENALKKNRAETLAMKKHRIWIPIDQRMREFDQMLELVGVVKKAIANA